jgi:hemin uptake protein HemP
MNLDPTTGLRPHDPVNDADAFQRAFVTGAPAQAANVRSITSEQLFAEFPEVQIAHGDAVYRLRQTSLGKLILTK